MAHGMVPHSWCRECQKAVSLAQYYAKREAYNQRSSDWQIANKEKARAAAKKWKDANQEHLRAYGKAKYDKNAERARAMSAAWKKANTHRVATNNRNRRALRAAAVGQHTQQDIDRLRDLQSDRCAYCRKALRGKFHVDHILPLSMGGTNDPKNLQLTCGSCNTSKGSRHPLEHARLTGRLV